MLRPNFPSSSLCLRAFVLCSAVAPLVGCIIPLGDGEVGDVRVGWAFDGEPRCAAVGVEEVTVQLSSNNNAAGVTAPCEGGNVIVPDVPIGKYDIFVNAVGETPWEGKETIEVVSGATADEGIVNLKPTTGNLQVAWRFDDDARCERVGVDEVSVQLVNDDNVTVGGGRADCLSGALRLVDLPAEHVAVVVEGTQNGNRVFTQTASAEIAAGDNEPLIINLEPAFATVRVRWFFGSTEPSADCVEMGVSSVAVQLFDAQDETVAGVSFACAQGAGDIGGLTPGNYRVVADAFSPQGALIFTERTNTPRGITATVVAGSNEVVTTLEVAN